MVNIGAYAKGSNPDIDRALAMIGPINIYLRQDVGEPAPLEECFAALGKIAAVK